MNVLQVARVAEEACIGCAACLKVCPTGALVGATGQVHTVWPLLCTGCGSCMEACPVPCIALHPWPGASHPMQGAHAAQAEAQTARHGARMANPVARVQKQGVAVAPVAVGALTPELAARAEAARAQAFARQKQKGPPKRPLLGS